MDHVVSTGISRERRAQPTGPIQAPRPVAAEVRNAHAVDILFDARCNVEITITIDGGCVDMYIMAPPCKCLAKTVDRYDGATVTPCRHIGGRDVQDSHGKAAGSDGDGLALPCMRETSAAMASALRSTV